jgi:hypothetical protein
MRSLNQAGEERGLSGTMGCGDNRKQRPNVRTTANGAEAATAAPIPTRINARATIEPNRTSRRE